MFFYSFYGCFIFFYNCMFGEVTLSSVRSHLSVLSLQPIVLYADIARLIIAIFGFVYLIIVHIDCSIIYSSWSTTTAVITSVDNIVSWHLLPWRCHALQARASGQRRSRSLEGLATSGELVITVRTGVQRMVFNEDVAAEERSGHCRARTSTMTASSRFSHFMCRYRLPATTFTVSFNLCISKS
jgi:hypothetical protein